MPGVSLAEAALWLGLLPLLTYWACFLPFAAISGQPVDPASFLALHREMIALQKDYAASEYVGYWHDFGHVQLKANLDMLDHAEWLRCMEPHLIGGHLHDVIWPASDHRVPFHGSINYDALIPCFAPEKPLVWELNPRRKAEDIRQALPLWKERYGQ